MTERLSVNILGSLYGALDRDLWDQIPQPEILTDEQGDNWLDLCETNAATYVIAPADSGTQGASYLGQPMCWVIIADDKQLYRWAIMPAAKLYEAMDDMPWLSYLTQSYLVGNSMAPTYRHGLPTILPTIARSLTPAQFVASMQGTETPEQEEDNDG